MCESMFAPIVFDSRISLNRIQGTSNFGEQQMNRQKTTTTNHLRFQPYEWIKTHQFYFQMKKILVFAMSEEKKLRLM